VRVVALAHPPAGYTVGHVPGDLLDLILLVLIAAFAVSGYRQGFIVGVLSFAGFLGGSAIGAAFGPGISRALSHSQTGQAVTAVVVLIVTAVLGMALGSTIGVAVRSRVTWRPATLVDAIGGAAVGGLSFLLIAWFFGSAIAYSSLPSIFPVLSRQVNNSALLRGVDKLMPAAATGAFSDFRRVLETGPYAQVFGALGAEIPLAVAPPNSAVLSSPGLAAARGSIVKVMGVAPSCSEQIEGSGFVYAPDHVLTNAHVVAGVTEGPDVFTSQGELSARVVLYDPQRDVAVLYVPGLDATPLNFAAQAATGADAIVAGYPVQRPARPDRNRRGGHRPRHLPERGGDPADLRDQGGSRARQLRRPPAHTVRQRLRRGVRRRHLGPRHGIRADRGRGSQRRQQRGECHLWRLHPGMRLGQLGRRPGPARLEAARQPAGSRRARRSSAGVAALRPSRSITSASPAARRASWAAPIPCGGAAA
jgi:S1-C subfamily serine protease